MKTIYFTFIFLCLSQNVDAKMIKIQGQIANFDVTELGDFYLFLMELKDDETQEITLDSLGKFEFYVEKKQKYRLEIYSTKYHLYKKSLQFRNKKTKTLLVKLTKRNKPLVSIDEVLFRTTIRTIPKTDNSKISIQGIVKDENGEPVMFANVAVYKNGALITGVQTDLDGKFHFNNLENGVYDVEASYVGYPTEKIRAIELTKENVIDLVVAMKQSVDEIIGCDFGIYGIPLMEHDNTTQGAIFNFDEIQRSPHKN